MKLNKDFNYSIRRLSSSQIEEYIVKESFNGGEEYIFNFDEFVQRLKIPANETSLRLFKLFLEPKEAQENVIDFKEYLLHALLLIKMQEPKIELLKLLFMVSEPRLPINLNINNSRSIFPAL